MKLTTLLLDNDGTCVDTEGLTVPHLLNKIRDVTGGRVDVKLDDFFARYHGGSGKGLIEAISRDYGYEVDFEAVYDNRVAAVAELLRTSRVRAAPGIGDVVSDLAAKGWEIAIVSNEPALRGLSALRNTENGDGAVVLQAAKHRYFEAGPKRKPDPDVYVNAMKTLGVVPEECLAIEDSKTGVLAAVAAGITCLGYTGLAYPRLLPQITQELGNSGARGIFKDWNYMAKYIDQLHSFSR